MSSSKSIHQYQSVMQEIEAAYRGYSQILRGTTQPYYLERVRERLEGYEYDPADVLVRESLLEHIGSLPLIMVALYPYIQDDAVDLGHSMILISIHDIGELATGDIITFLKKSGDKVLERKEALKLLNPYYHTLYEEVEDKTTNSARFAKSIDKIAPDLLDYFTPADITVERFERLMHFKAREIVPAIRKFKQPYMEWNDFMKGFHTFLTEKLDEKLSPYY